MLFQQRTENLPMSFGPVPKFRVEQETKRTLVFESTLTHEKQVLDMTQMEAFLEFKKKNPNLKMGQRSFEKCRPFFVIPPRAQDRNSCCCKLHVEIRMIFKACVDCRRKLVSKKDVNSGVCNVHEHAGSMNMLEETLCPKGNSKYHACL